MSHSDPSPEIRRKLLRRALRIALLAVVVVCGLLLIQGPELWGEFQGLRNDRRAARQNVVIGYVNISPHVSLAQRPANWFHDEGDETLLWSGWDSKRGHGWFRIGQGELDPERLSPPLGRDVIAVIDRPVSEFGGGTRWERIPPEHTVIGLGWEGYATAYPMRLLEKVILIHDEVGGRPLLISFTPYRDPGRSVEVFDPIWQGRRIRMGLTGYLMDRKSLMYDRQTESLWVSRDAGLEAIAGRLKGARLMRLGRPVPQPWSDWRWQHPQGRLVIGSQAAPAEAARPPAPLPSS